MPRNSFTIKKTRNAQGKALGSDLDALESRVNYKLNNPLCLINLDLYVHEIKTNLRRLLETSTPVNPIENPDTFNPGLKHEGIMKRVNET